jgi:hypothetical protein
MDELFAPQAKSSREKYQALKDHIYNWVRQKRAYASLDNFGRQYIAAAYDITIVDMCFERLSDYIYPGFGNCNKEWLNHFYQMSLTGSIPQFFLDSYMDSDLGISDATDQLINNLIDEITLFLDDTDEDVW